MGCVPLLLMLLLVGSVGGVGGVGLVGGFVVLVGCLGFQCSSSQQPCPSPLAARVQSGLWRGCVC